MNNVNISELAQAAITMHELFTELQEAGFNERQALRIVSYVSMGHPPQ